MVYQGYIKLYRKIREKKWWRKQRSKFTWGQAFIDLLLRTSHKDTEIPFNGGVLKIPKGSFITSQRKLSKDWGWSISTVNDYLRWMEKHEKAIAFKTAKSHTHIFFLNWPGYQEEKKKLATSSPQTHPQLKGDKQNTDPNTLLKGKTKRPEHLPEHLKKADPNTSRTPAETINNVKECKRNINKLSSKKLTRKKIKTMPQITHHLISHFQSLVKQKEGITPEIPYATAANRITYLLTRTEERFAPKQIADIFDFYIESPKYKDFGANINAALSAHTLNLYKLKNNSEDYE